MYTHVHMFICMSTPHARTHAHTRTHTQHGTYRVAEEAVAGVDTTNNIGDHGAAVEAYPYLYCSFAFVGCVFVCVCMCVLKPRIETELRLRAHSHYIPHRFTINQHQAC